MAEGSVNLKKLKELAGEFADLATDTDLPEWVYQTNLHPMAWPMWMAGELPDTYARTQQQFADAVEAIRNVTSTIQEALDAVADYYDKNETDSESDADSVDVD